MTSLFENKSPIIFSKSLMVSFSSLFSMEQMALLAGSYSMAEYIFKLSL